MPVTKQIFSIDIAPETQSDLEAHLLLARLTYEGCFHNSSGLRAPLGIYNVSVSRACDKLLRLCQRLEQYFKATDTLDPASLSDDLMLEVIDYVELSLYAAAEHVDDIVSIATGFFESRELRDKHAAYRALEKEVKAHKRLVSAAANAIKHQQSRIRIFSMEYLHSGASGRLHGYFIEGVQAGVVGPSKTFHQSQDVFSITTLIWEIIVFLLQCSRELARFLGAVAIQKTGPVDAKFEPMSKVVVAASKLPIYTFGEEHPFSRVTLSIRSTDPSATLPQSELYGSLTRRWSKTGAATFGRSVSRFVGDGVTTSFRFAQPKSVVLHHWS